MHAQVQWVEMLLWIQGTFPAGKANLQHAQRNHQLDWKSWKKLWRVFPIILYVYHEITHLQNSRKKRYLHILTEKKKWSNCRSIFLAFTKISSLFLEAKWTSTLCVKWLNLSSSLSVIEINFNSFSEVSNSAVYFITFWKSSIFDASSGTA